MTEAGHRMQTASIRPSTSKGNSFVELFSESIRQNGIAIRNFVWHDALFPRQSAIILHWPEYFFLRSNKYTEMKFAALRIAKLLYGVKLVWIVHNIEPHDTGSVDKRMAARFLNLLDGAIHLNSRSPALLHEAYGISPRRELVVPHGNYIPGMHRPAMAEMRDFHPIRLFNFGLIRRYKNLEDLADCANRLADPDLRLEICGHRKDEVLCDRLEALARAGPGIKLDLRPDVLPQQELEEKIDASHAVALPYAAINNSGAAIFALSRNRPVLAPRLGAMPELLDEVGGDWLYLYDGCLTPEILRAFAGWVKSRRPAAPPDLSARDWQRIGPRVADFLRSL